MTRSWPYVVIALCLIAFGVLGIFSIGFPFLATGLVMIALLPVKRSLDVILPPIAAVWGFTLTYLLVAPLGCSTSASAPAGQHVTGVTVCNGVFFDYIGRGRYAPPLLPAVIIGLVGGVAAAVTVRMLARRRLASMTA